jgi:hypothetical protein
MFGDLMDEESFLGRGGRIVCEEGIAEFVEELLVFAFEDYVEMGGESVADGVGADGLFAGFGHLVRTGGVAAIGFDLASLSSVAGCGRIRFSRFHDRWSVNCFRDGLGVRC